MVESSLSQLPFKTAHRNLNPQLRRRKWSVPKRRSLFPSSACCSKPGEITLHR